MKNLSNLEGFKSNFDLLPKIPMRMKLAAFCLTCFLSTASAGTLYSQSARISLDMRNASVEQVLQEIEESSEFYFMYNSKLVNVDRKVNIKVKDKSIETILNEICKAANIEYSVNDKQIILRPKGMDAHVINIFFISNYSNN